MTRVEAIVECPIHDSFRVQQTAGLFDVPAAGRAVERFEVEAPDLASPWQVGLIVGPSGSGKSTIARKLFGESVVAEQTWPRDRAVVDCFGPLSIKRITGLLTAVGFGSPPSWIKPYWALSRGEQFRCDLARALAGEDDKATELPIANQKSQIENPLPIVVFDEFTSVVDRTVARVASAAVAKGVRAGWIGCRFVAVTCHYDVTRWLAPDWVLDMGTGELTYVTDRRRLRRPAIRLAVHRCRHGLWRMFARHHYLSGELNRAARCFVALWRKAPVAFCATLAVFGKRGRRRISRLVTLPDYQGVGIGMRLAETVAELEAATGERMNITASHPALITHCRRSAAWRAVRVRRTGSRPCADRARGYRGSPGRAVVSFEYVGQAFQPDGSI